MRRNEYPAPKKAANGHRKPHLGHNQVLAVDITSPFILVFRLAYHELSNCLVRTIEIIGSHSMRFDTKFISILPSYAGHGWGGRLFFRIST
jgi:hypothetical protein